MANGKEQLDAFKFGRRRIVANLIAPSPTGSDEGAPRPVRTFFASIMIGVVGVAAMVVLGYVHPSAPSGWQSGLAEDSTTGAPYVFHDGELHPVLNITSAQLLLGKSFRKYDVPDSTIVAQKMGAPYGILGAPPVVPTAGHADLANWTMCQLAKNPLNQATPGGQTVLEVGYNQGSMTAVSGANGFIVHDTNGPGHDYLLYGDFSYLISPVGGLIDALDDAGNDNAGLVGPWVNDTFLQAFQTGSPIAAFPTVDGLGGPATAPNQPPGARIGDFGSSGGAYYIETKSGLAQVTEFVYELYVSNGALAKNHLDGFNPPLTQSEITDAVPIDETKDPADIRNVGATWPGKQVNTEDLDAVEPNFSVLCVDYAGKFGADVTQNQVPQLSMWYGSQPPDSNVGAGVASSGSQYANLIDVQPGHAALSRDVANGDSAKVGPIYLTVSTGSRYELMTDQPAPGSSTPGLSAQTQLQYSGLTPEPVPDNWMSLIPAGARLDPAAAGRPNTTIQ